MPGKITPSVALVFLSVSRGVRSAIPVVQSAPFGVKSANRDVKLGSFDHRSETFGVKSLHPEINPETVKTYQIFFNNLNAVMSGDVDRFMCLVSVCSTLHRHVIFSSRLCVSAVQLPLFFASSRANFFIK